MKDKFFEKKRPWSRYKDEILRYYLEPYIAKAALLRKPVLIVDCFAGCGRFGDGEDGSPLIICKTIQKLGTRKAPVKGEFIEGKRENYDALVDSLQPYRAFATPRLGTFEEHLPELAERAKENTVFLYVDPYTVKALVFDKMKAVYEKIRTATASVEILLNFNLATLMRWGLAALKAKGKAAELARAAEDDEADYLADDPEEKVELATLDAIAGGDYWRDIAADKATPFPDKLRSFTEGYLERLASCFPFAAACEIRSRYRDQVPKYVLVYGTRHSDGVELMNDGTCKARLQFLGQEFAKDTLFDMTPADEIPDEYKIKDELVGLTQAYGPLTREDLRKRLIWKRFGQLQGKDVNHLITSLLKAERSAQ